jgi:hypothetical protein
VDYYGIEGEISRRAKVAARDVYGQITLTEHDLELLSLTSEFGDAQQSIKGKDDTEDDTVKKLITKLVLRRIALYCLCKGISAENTAKLLMYGNTLAAITDSNKKQTISKLHLQTDTDIPYHILTEERTWLEKDMGIPVFAMRQTLDVTIDIVNQIINKPENKKKLKSLQSELPIDSNGNISALSVQELKVVVNKVLKVINPTEDGKELRDELWNTAVKLIELLPGMKHPEELKKLIEDYERKGVNNDLRN